jgi:hypothetical protein
MAKSRRQFLATSLGAIGAAAALRTQAQNPQDLPPAAPPAFGTGPAVGPEVSANTFAEAEKLVQFPMTANEREVAAGSWRKTMAMLYERRVGPRKVALETAISPATIWNPILPGQKQFATQDRFVRTKADPGPLPSRDADIAFSPVTQPLPLDRAAKAHLGATHQHLPQAHRAVRSQTALHHHPHARPRLAQAKQADAEIASGKYRGPLHGIPWGGKDLLDTAGIPTTYGAEPFRNRIPTEDAAVTRRLHAAGAVLIAKLSSRSACAQ